jgi:hypothetical protein
MIGPVSPPYVLGCPICLESVSHAAVIEPSDETCPGELFAATKVTRITSSGGRADCRKFRSVTEVIFGFPLG